MSDLEIAKAEQAALVTSADMKQEFMDGPPVLDLAQAGWWGLLRALAEQCQAAGRCLDYGQCTLGSAPPEPVVAAHAEFARELGHTCCECPCGQFREWVLTLTDPKTVRIGVADIAAWRASIYAAECCEEKAATFDPVFGGTLTAESEEEAVEAYVIGQRADRAEADADHALELVTWERRYANASDEVRRKMAKERKGNAFDRVYEAHMDMETERAMGGV